MQMYYIADNMESGIVFRIQKSPSSGTWVVLEN